MHDAFAIGADQHVAILLPTDRRGKCRHIIGGLLHDAVENMIHLAQCSCIRHKIDTYSLVLEVERDDWIGKLLRIGVDCIVLTATRNVLAIVRGKSNEILFIQVSAPNREHT
jgi:hypothetical protein